jgi:hypothetical protein
MWITLDGSAILPSWKQHRQTTGNQEEILHRATLG